MGVLSLAGIIAAAAVRPYWSGWLGGAGANLLYGPLDAAGAWRDLFFSLAEFELCDARDSGSPGVPHAVRGGPG